MALEDRMDLKEIQVNKMRYFLDTKNPNLQSFIGVTKTGSTGEADNTAAKETQK